MAEGAAVRDLVADIRETAAALTSATTPGWAPSARTWRPGGDALQRGDRLADRAARRPPTPWPAPRPILKLMGDVVGGWMLAKGALSASGARTPTLTPAPASASPATMPRPCWPRPPGRSPRSSPAAMRSGLWTKRRCPNAAFARPDTTPTAYVLLMPGGLTANGTLATGAVRCRPCSPTVRRARRNPGRGP